MSGRAVCSLVVALALAGALPGCGGSSPTGPVIPPQPQPGFRFQPEQVPVPPSSLSLQIRAAGETEITLALAATTIQALYGYGLDIVFPTDLLSFVSVEERDYLTGEEITTSLQVVESPEGRLVIGHTRVGDAPAASGNGETLRIVFRAEAAGSGRITLEAGSAFDDEGEVVTVAFFGGTVTFVE